jgi:hypothetical protein
MKLKTTKQNSTHRYWIQTKTGIVYYFQTKENVIDFLIYQANGYQGDGIDWGEIGTDGTLLLYLEM